MLSLIIYNHVRSFQSGTSPDSMALSGHSCLTSHVAPDKREEAVELLEIEYTTILVLLNLLNV